jgi:hypothetical protein
MLLMEKVCSVQIILHENYDDLTLENDICLLHLRHEVTLGPVVGKLAARWSWGGRSEG